MKNLARWTIIEYGKPAPVLREMALSSGITLAQTKQLVQVAGERIAINLNMKRSPLTVERDSIHASRIAGLIRLSPGIELEMVPKFLGHYGLKTEWREDFFFLAMLSRHGKILSSERLRSGHTAARSLPALVARTMIETQRANSRRPLRTYRRHTDTSFDLDGELDAESVALPSADGFIQESVRYDRRNIYNANIKAAFRLLQREVRDPEISAQIGRCFVDLGTQNAVINPRYRRLPNRARRWQEQHDLAVDVQKGLGISFTPDSSPRSPGYVLSTWQMWEDLVTVATRMGFTESDIHVQTPIVWGTRARIEYGRVGEESNLPVKPDIRLTSVGELGGIPTLIIDAKYRTRAWLKVQRIEESDVYEALAFARASRVDCVLLLYPSVPSEIGGKLGSVNHFETVTVEGIQIYGLQIEVRGISETNGLRVFSANLRDGIVALSAGSV